ncbi:MAG: hypothetical protein ACUVT2_03950 [Thiobacillaceae bacterium]
MSWIRQLRELAAVMRTAKFWYTLMGVLVALLIWFYLFYLAVKHLDTSLSMHSTFCDSHEQRNRHILVITLLTPLFLVGLLGVIGEWMQFVENRHKGRKTPLKPLILFLVLMQVTALFILIALNC